KNRAGLPSVLRDKKAHTALAYPLWYYGTGMLLNHIFTVCPVALFYYGDSLSDMRFAGGRQNNACQATGAGTARTAIMPRRMDHANHRRSDGSSRARQAALAGGSRTVGGCHKGSCFRNRCRPGMGILVSGGAPTLSGAGGSVRGLCRAALP